MDEFDDTEDRDSLDERIDSEQRIRNQQLWTSFQNAASCITKLYRDRSQPNISPWVPFQHAASNLTTLYKDCIESQKRFARIGYQVGRRKQLRDLNRSIKKYRNTSNDQQALNNSPLGSHTSAVATAAQGVIAEDHDSNQMHTNVASILAVNQINLDCDESPSHSKQAQETNQMQLPQQQLISQPSQQNLQIVSGNNDDDLLTFQSALAQPTSIRGIRSTPQKRANNSGFAANRTSSDLMNEEERLNELNQFLSEEYHRHVGSKKRSSPSSGGNHIKRLRE